MITITTPTTSTPVSSELAKVNDIRTSSQQTLQALFNRWRGNMIRVWSDSNPQAVLDAWQTAFPGEPAKVFQQNAQTVAYLEQMTPGCTTSTMALVKPFTVNQSTGAITITQ